MVRLTLVLFIIINWTKTAEPTWKFNIKTENLELLAKISPTIHIFAPGSTQPLSTYTIEGDSTGILGIKQIPMDTKTKLEEKGSGDGNEGGKLQDIDENHGNLDVGTDSDVTLIAPICVIEVRVDCSLNPVITSIQYARWLLLYNTCVCPFYREIRLEVCKK